MMEKSTSGGDLHNGGRVIEEQGPVWRVPRKSYCIEPSERAIMLFERLLRLCVDRHDTKTKSSDGAASSSEGMNVWCIVWCILRVLRANLSQLLGDLRTTWLLKPDEEHASRQSNDFSSSGAFRGASSNGESPSMSGPAAGMPLAGSPVSPEKRRISVPSSPISSFGPEVHSPKLQQGGVSGASAKSSTERRKRRRRRDHAEFLRICASFRGIHALLLQLIDSPLKILVSALVAQGLDEMTANLVSERSAAMIVSEAAETIKMGFELFYPTATDCKILLEKCMRSTKAKPVNEVLLKAVMEKLAEENSVASLLEPLSDEMATNKETGTGNFSVLASPSSSSSAASAAAAFEPQNAIDKLLADLLAHSRVHLFANLDNALSSSGTTAATETPEASPYLKLLLAIQKHLCSHWIQRGSHAGQSSQTSSSKRPVSESMLPTEMCLLVYGKRLLTCTSECLAKLIGMGDTDVLSKDRVARIMTVSFIAQLLPPFAASMCLVKPNSTLVMHLLLPLVKLLEVMNQCCLHIGTNYVSEGKQAEEKYEGGTSSSFVSSSSPSSSTTLVYWLHSLFGLIGHLAGRLLATVNIAGTPTAKETSMEGWLSSKLVAGGLYHAAAVDTATIPSSATFPLDQPQDISSTAALVLLLDQSSELLGSDEDSKWSPPNNDSATSEGISETQEAFLLDLMAERGDAASLDDWMLSQCEHDTDADRGKEMNAARLCQRSITAVLLAHNGLVTEALTAAATLKKKKKKKKKTQELENSALQNIWQAAINVERRLALQKQSSVTEESVRVNKRAVQLALVADKNAAAGMLPLTHNVAKMVMRKCSFLLSVSPAFSISLGFNSGVESGSHSQDDKNINTDARERQSFLRGLWGVIHDYRREIVGQNTRAGGGGLATEQGCSSDDPAEKTAQSSREYQRVPLEELYKFMSLPVDVASLEMFLKRRFNRGQIRSFGMRLTRHVLSIISPRFGTVRAEVLTHLPSALAQYSRVYGRTSSNSQSSRYRSSTSYSVPSASPTSGPLKMGHYVDGLSGCGPSVYADVNKSFILLFQDLTSFLEESLGNQTMQQQEQGAGHVISSINHLQSAVLRCWGLRVFSTDHLRNSTRANTYANTASSLSSPSFSSSSSLPSADVFGAGALLLSDGLGNAENLWQSKSKLRSKFFLLLGRMLGGFAGSKSSRPQKNKKNRISDADILANWNDAATRALHRTAWSVFHLLSLQVAVLGEQHRVDRAENERMYNASYDDEELNEATSAVKQHSECTPIFKVLFSELERVHTVLEERATLENMVTRIAKISSMQYLLPCLLPLSPSRVGAHVPDLPLRRKNNCFAVSFFIKLAPTSLDQGPSRYVVCMSTRPHQSGASGERDDDALADSEVELCPAIFIKYEELAVAAGKRSGSGGSATFVPYLEMVLSSKLKNTSTSGSQIKHNLARSARPLPVDRWVHIVATYTEPAALSRSKATEGKSAEATATLLKPRIELFFDGQRSASSPVMGTCVRQLGRPFHIGAPDDSKSSIFVDAKSACKKWDCKGSACALVAGVAWHDNGLKPSEISDLSCMPSPAILAKKNIASEYSWRLCGLLLSLVHTRVGICTLVHDQKWVSLLLNMLRCTSARVQRCILRILSLVLLKMKPFGISAPAIKVAVGTGRSAAAAGRGAVGLWQYLSNMVGVAWWCSSSDAEAGVCGDVNSVLVQFLPEYLSPTLEQALLMATARNEVVSSTVPVSGSGYSRRSGASSSSDGGGAGVASSTPEGGDSSGSASVAVTGLGGGNQGNQNNNQGAESRSASLLTGASASSKTNLNGTVLGEEIIVYESDVTATSHPS